MRPNALVREILFSLLLLAPGIPLGVEAAPVQESEVSSGLKTRAMIESDPPGLRVTWISWDSGFRKTGLKVGDLIVAIDGQKVDPPKEKEKVGGWLGRMIGQSGEAAGWAAKGARDGTTVTLTVRRHPQVGKGFEVLGIRGSLRPERNYLDGKSRRLLAPEGPEVLAKDGFPDSWRSWYDLLVQKVQEALDGFWQKLGGDSRKCLKKLLEEKARLEFLLKKYPGPFAEAAKADWGEACESLAGRRYELRPEDLAYRDLGEKRVAEISEAGRRAREEFLRKWEKDTIDPFPAIDPIFGDRDKVKGKVVNLPPLEAMNLVVEGEHAYLWAGDIKKGSYFIDCLAPGADRMFEARIRYEKKVTPKIKRVYSIVARIVGTPAMVYVGKNQAVKGLWVEVLGATVGDRMFVDVTTEKEKISPFAGEDLLRPVPFAAPGKDAPPQQVVEASIAALKNSDEPSWKELFATWRAGPREGGRTLPLYYPYSPSNTLDTDWRYSRRRILEDIYDVRVVYVGEVRRIITGKEFVGAPVVDEVTLEVDHIGRFDGEYRTFKIVGFHRIWTLQRCDEGPWKITGHSGL